MPYILRLPSRYLAEDATGKDKQVYDYFKARADEINAGTLQAIVLPSDRDETGSKLFDLEYIKGE